MQGRTVATIIIERQEMTRNVYCFECDSFESYGAVVGFLEQHHIFDYEVNSYHQALGASIYSVSASTCSDLAIPDDLSSLLVARNSIYFDRMPWT